MGTATRSANTAALGPCQGERCSTALVRDSRHSAVTRRRTTGQRRSCGRTRRAGGPSLAVTKGGPAWGCQVKAPAQPRNQLSGRGWPTAP